MHLLLKINFECLCTKWLTFYKGEHLKTWRRLILFHRTKIFRTLCCCSSGGWFYASGGAIIFIFCCSSWEGTFHWRAQWLSGGYRQFLWGEKSTRSTCFVLLSCSILFLPLENSHFFHPWTNCTYFLSLLWDRSKGTRNVCSSFSYCFSPRYELARYYTVPDNLKLRIGLHFESGIICTSKNW